VFGYISVVAEEGVCVRDYRALGLCEVRIIGCSVGDEYEGGRGSLVTRWGELDRKVSAGGREWERGKE
jgi:hypothetical protein